MTAILRLLDHIENLINSLAGSWLLPTFARFTFAATLLLFFWRSATTKLGDGALGFLSPGFNGYAQIFPKTMEALNYDASQLGVFHWVVAVAGTWGEFILPMLIVIGLLTRLAALGMIGFIIVMTIVDVNGHGVAFGGIFNGGQPNELVDQRLFWMVALLVLLRCGAGPISVDRLLGRA